MQVAYRVAERKITETVFVAYGHNAEDAQMKVHRNWAAIRKVAHVPERIEYEVTAWGPEEIFTIVSTDNSRNLCIHHVEAPTATLARERWEATDHGKRLEYHTIKEGKFDLTSVA